MKKLRTYVNESGVTVTVYETARPRKDERTWFANSKYSIANVGHQASSTGRRGVFATTDKVMR